jgi:glycosyltransferase involved in cell wall biosynthesis
MPNKISVITVVYNNVAEIEGTLCSVLEQSYSAVEYIVIDGGSTDGTVAIIAKYINRLAYFVSEPDNGLYDAMNKGIKASSGEWLLFLNSGDRFFNNDVLKEVFENRHTPNQVDILYGSTVYTYSNGAVMRKPQPLEVIKQGGLPFCHQAAFVKGSLIREVLYNTAYKIIADYDFFLKCYSAKKIFVEVPKIISIYEGENGISAKTNNSLNIHKEQCLILNKRFSYCSFYKQQLLLKGKKLLLSVIPSLWIDILMKREHGLLTHKPLTQITQL